MKTISLMFAVLALLVPSPTSDFASMRATDSEVAASSRAMAEPTMPAPITATSTRRAASAMSCRSLMPERQELLGLVGRPLWDIGSMGLPVAHSLLWRQAR